MQQDNGNERHTDVCDEMKSYKEDMALSSSQYELEGGIDESEGETLQQHT